MAKTTYQVILSADGNHKVTASTDDPAALQEALEAVKMTYGWVDYYMNQGQLQKIKAVIPASDEPKISTQQETPTCPNHNNQMKWIDRNGGFWSCHKKNSDGSWCNYRPGKAVA